MTRVQRNETHVEHKFKKNSKVFKSNINTFKGAVDDTLKKIPRIFSRVSSTAKR